VNSTTVSYADLNLAAKPAQLTLKRRIFHAAREVCVYEDSQDLNFASQVNSCRKGAISGAEPAYEAAVAAARRGSVTVMDAAALIVTAP
jgi:UrcA family protein